MSTHTSTLRTPDGRNADHTGLRLANHSAPAYVLLGLLLLGSFGLRWYGIDKQSLWVDEGVSVYYAAQGPAKIVQDGFGLEVNPPLYYLVLWAWLQLWPSSEAGVRSLSALFSTLCVLPAFWLGKGLGNVRVGLLAAMATAISPFLLWQAQEARASALMGLLAALLLCLTHRMTTRSTGALAVLWVVVATLVLYTHLYGVFAVAACAVVLLPLLRRRPVLTALTLAIPALSYWPWIAATIASNPSQTWRAPAGALEILGRALATVTHYGMAADAWAFGFGAATAGLTILGLWTARWQKSATLVLQIILPLAASYAISLRQPIFAERYLATIALPAYVAAGLGIECLHRHLRIIAPLAALAMIVLGTQTVQVFQQPTYAKENFRAAARMVERLGNADDVVLFVADYAKHPFAFYYRGSARLVGFTGDANDPEPFMESTTASAGRLWLLESHAEFADPQHRVRAWLEERYPLATEAYPIGIHLRAFTIGHEVASAPAHAIQIGASFAALRLVAAEFPAVSAARDSELHPPSAWLPVKLFWQAESKPTSDYRVLLQLVDAKGVWAVNLARGGDLFAKMPTSKWTAGSVRVHHSDLVLNPAMPTGRYRLQLAVLAGDSPVGGSDSLGRPLNGPLPLGEIEIVDESN